jgi:hypothetical protein
MSDHIIEMPQQMTSITSRAPNTSCRQNNRRHSGDVVNILDPGCRADRVDAGALRALHSIAQQCNALHCSATLCIANRCTAMQVRWTRCNAANLQRSAQETRRSEVRSQRAGVRARHSVWGCGVRGYETPKAQSNQLARQASHEDHVAWMASVGKCWQDTWHVGKLPTRSFCIP